MAEDSPLSDRARRQVERLLDEADDAINRGDWPQVRAKAEALLRFDPGNVDARSYLQAATRDVEVTATPLLARESEASGTTAATSAAHPSSFVGGRYQVVRFLGEGGKKRVYLAQDTRLEREVAFSLLKVDGLDVESHTRLRREAQAMARLGDHPNIVAVHDIGEEGGQPYLVCQYMAGGSLDRVLLESEEHRLSLSEALRIADQVCQALEHAHSQGIIHRDLKPGNVWLTGERFGVQGLGVGATVASAPPNPSLQTPAPKP